MQIKKLWMAAGAAAMLLISGGAYAGYKSSGGSTAVSATYASGTMGGTRASADTNAYLGCSLYGSPTGTAGGWCTIVDASNVTKTCSFSSAAMVQTVQSITSNSAIRLFFDASGNCTQIYVDNYSFYLPIVP